MRGKRALIMLDRAYPCDHAFIEEVLRDSLQRHGWELHFIFRGQLAKNHSGWEVEYRWEGYQYSALYEEPCVRTSIRKWWLRLRTYVKVVSLIRQIIGSWQPSVVIVRNDLMFLAIASSMASCPIIYQLSHFKARDIMERADLAGNPSQWLLGSFLERLRRLSMRLADQIWAISDQMKNELVSEGVAADRVWVIPLGAAFQESEERNQSVPGLYERAYWIYVGTLNPVRRLDMLIRAWRLVESDCDLVFLGGDRDPDERNRLEALAEQFGLAGRVRFLRDVPRLKVRAYLENALGGLSVMPAKGTLRTISPTKVFEYLAAGIPVIVSEGIDEQVSVVRAAQSGVVVPWEDRAIAKAVDELTSDRCTARRMGARGARWVLKNRSFERIGWMVDLAMEIAMNGTTGEGLRENQDPGSGER